MSKNKRLGVRLAQETLLGIEMLKKEFENDEMFSDLRITNGLAVSQAYLETKDFDNSIWETVIKSDLNKFFDSNIEKLDVVTNLYLEQDVIDGIQMLKGVFPQLSILKVNYVTTSYVIRQMIKGSLLKRRDVI